MRTIRTLLSAVALCSLTQTSADAADTTFPKLKHRSQYVGCPGDQVAKDSVPAVDVSEPLDNPRNPALAGLKDNGVKVVFRYYDWADDPKNPDPNVEQPFDSGKTNYVKDNGFEFNWRKGPSFAGKRLTKPELEAIHKAGLLVGVVFQHFNSSLKTFQDSGRPKFDANRALDLAKEFNQPTETVIFFGADHAFSKDDYKHIEKYFSVVHPIITAGRYKVGVYGEGYVCKSLMKAGFASHCWLSQSIDKTFLGSVEYEREDKWQVKQCAERLPFVGSRTTFDSDLLKVDIKEIGF